MKIAIVGRHPDLEKGFNGVMSLLWARGLSKNGCKVVLFLPDTEVHDPEMLLAKAGFSSYDSLKRFGDDFEIRPFKYARELDADIDAIIWQSYRPQEECLRKSIKEKGFFLAKNPPRLFSGDKERDYIKAKGLSQEYDFIGVSLCSDYQESLDLEPLLGKVEYVPRGFDTGDLVPYKKENPVIGFDRAVKANDLGTLPIDHIVRAGEEIKSRYKSVEFLSLRDNVETLKSRRIPLLGYPDFYSEFINRLWIYMPINFDYSIHVKGKVRDNYSGHRYVGLYENQVVETQLAGGVVVCRNGDIPEELLMMPEYSVVSSYDDIPQLVSLLAENIDNFEHRSKAVRERAISKHNYLDTTKIMKDEISKRL